MEKERNGPRFDILGKELPYGNARVIEYAMAGRETIQKYFEENKQGLSSYADDMESGKLITERGLLGKFVQKIGLGAVLPNQIRFKK